MISIDPIIQRLTIVQGCLKDAVNALTLNFGIILDSAREFMRVVIELNTSRFGGASSPTPVNYSFVRSITARAHRTANSG